MLTLYILTGIGFAALTLFRCLRNDVSTEDYVTSAIAATVSGVIWPAILAAMILREAFEEREG